MVRPAGQDWKEEIRSKLSRSINGSFQSLKKKNPGTDSKAEKDSHYCLIVP